MDIEEVPPVRLQEILHQTRAPVLIRRGPGYKLLVRLPYDVMNRGWLRISGTWHPEWDEKRKQWEVPQAWFDDLVKRCLVKYGCVYIVQPYREQEKCATSCWEAKGEECQCSCMGVNHGSLHPGGNWKIISDAFATRWGDRELACRLLITP